MSARPLRRPMGAGAVAVRPWRATLLRALLGLVIALVGVGSLGFLYQATATVLDRRAYPPPGRLVDVGGYAMHLSCAGRGSPTVVFESGLANMTADCVGAV